MRMKLEEKILYHVVKGAESTGLEEGLIRFKEDRWILKCQTASGEQLFAAMVPESDMEEYDKGGVDSIGINFQQVKKVLSNSSDSIVVEFFEDNAGIHKLRLIQDNSYLNVGLVDEDFISGTDTEAPNLDWVVEINGDISFIKDFVDKSDKVIGSGDFMIGAREGTMYLFSEQDDSSAYEILHWEDFDDYSINWDNGLYNGDGHNPPEDHAMDVILSVEWTKNIHYVSDDATLMLNNHAPMKIVFDTEGDWVASYFISPRVVGSDSGTKETVPEDLIEKRGLEST